MGVTVRQKKKGKGNPWYVFIHLNGRIQSKIVGDKKLAQSVATKLKRKLINGQLDLDKNTIPEFSAYAKHYLEDYAKTACKRNTWESYEIIIRRHLIPAWKGKRLNEIKRADVKKLLSQKLLAGLSPKTVQNIKALVSGIFTHAYEEDLLSMNPALKLSRHIMKRDQTKHINTLTKEEVSKVLSLAFTEYPEYYPLLLCAFRTGMRLGELLGLAWEDIDFEANTIHVRRSYSHKHFSTPKSHKSRIVDMSDQLRKTLLAHRMNLFQKFEGQLPEYQLPENFKPNDLIRLAFINQDGGTLDPDYFRLGVFYKLLEKAKVHKIRIHDIRHTFASMLLLQGEPLNYVMEQLGHASIQTTVDVYGHIVPGSNRNAVNMLDDKVVPNIRVVNESA